MKCCQKISSVLSGVLRPKNYLNLFQAGETSFTEAVTAFAKFYHPDVCFVVVDAVDEIAAYEKNFLTEKLFPENVICVVRNRFDETLQPRKYLNKPAIYFTVTQPIFIY